MFFKPRLSSIGVILLTRQLVEKQLDLHTRRINVKEFEDIWSNIETLDMKSNFVYGVECSFHKQLLRCYFGYIVQLIAVA